MLVLTLVWAVTPSFSSSASFLAHLGCSPQQQLVAKRRFLPAEIDTLRAGTTCDSLQNLLGLSADDLSQLVSSHPQFLTSRSSGHIVPLLSRLQHALQLSDRQLKRVVLAQPQLLSCSFENNLEPKLHRLQQELALTDSELRAMIVSMPALLAYSWGANIQPTLVSLRARLGLTAPELKRVLKRHVQVGRPCI